MSKTKPSLPRGTRDFGPEVAAKRTYIIDTIKRNFRTYGFSQIETPALENLSVLTGKYGDEGDQLLFKVLKNGDFLSKSETPDFEKGSAHLLNQISDKGLRYDLTVPFARYVVMHQNEITFPFKRFQIQPVWRADRPQKGRYREFYQCDADIVGSKGIWSEVELTLLFGDVFKELKFEDYLIKVNHREILFLLASYVGLKDKMMPFCVEVDKLDKIGAEEVSKNIIRLGADPLKIEEVLALFTVSDQDELMQKIKQIDAENKGVIEMEEYLAFLEKFTAKKPKVSLDFSLARGLSYYTGMIFEVKPTSVKMGSICGGGRYDDLTGVFGLPDVSGIGISFGLDRIYDVLSELDLFPADITNRLDVLLLHFDDATMAKGAEMVFELRDRGVKADLYPQSAKIKKQFNYADKIQVPYTIVIGEDELTGDSYAVKNMQTGEQKRQTLEEIIELFQS